MNVDRIMSGQAIDYANKFRTLVGTSQLPAEEFVRPLSQVPENVRQQLEQIAPASGAAALGGARLEIPHIQ